LKRRKPIFDLPDDSRDAIRLKKGGQTSSRYGEDGTRYQEKEKKAKRRKRDTRFIIMFR